MRDVQQNASQSVTPRGTHDPPRLLYRPVDETIGRYPRPLEHLHMTDPRQPLSDTEMHELDAWLEARAERIVAEQGEDVDPGVCSLSELDGFLTAIVSGPNTVLPSAWLPAMAAGHDLHLDDQADAQHVLELIMRHMNGIAGTLMQAPDSFDPIFDEFEELDQPFVLPWCAGYVRAMDLDEGWNIGDDELALALLPILVFGAELDDEITADLDDPDLDLMAAQIPDCARSIHAYWLARRAPGHSPVETAVREAPKVGRNAPCPCGSGRKYKHCCLH